MHKKKALLKYLSSLLLFGSNGIVASCIALPSYDIVLLRTLIGGLLLAAIFLFSGRRPAFLTQRRALFFLAVSGAAMGGSWILLYEAYRLIGVSIASLAYYCGPVIVMALSPLLFGEPLTRPRMAGFAIVLCGVFLVNGQALQGGQSPVGLIYGGIAAVLYAVLVIANKKAAAITGLENAAGQLLFSFLTVAAFVLLRDGPVLHLSARDWVPALMLGLVNTGLGCYLYFSAMVELPVQTVAICGYLEPLSAVVFSVLFLRESMTPLQVLGAACILGGAVLGEYFSGRRAAAS